MNIKEELADILEIQTLLNNKIHEINRLEFEIAKRVKNLEREHTTDNKQS